MAICADLARSRPIITLDFCNTFANNQASSPLINGSTNIAPSLEMIIFFLLSSAR